MTARTSVGRLMELRGPDPWDGDEPAITVTPREVIRAEMAVHDPEEDDEPGACTCVIGRGAEEGVVLRECAACAPREPAPAWTCERCGGEFSIEEGPYVCPGCHAVCCEPCAPGCIDDEMRREDEEDERTYAAELLDEDEKGAA